MGKRKYNSGSIIYALLVFIPLIIYIQVRGFSFVWDDIDLYLNKDNFPDKFTAQNYLEFWSPASEKMYMPITYTFWTFAKIIGGENPNEKVRFNAGTFHTFNLIFHILNGILVFLILRQLLKKSDWISFAGALLFLLHPVQVESVAWVSELRGQLAAFFGFLSILIYINYLDGQKKLKKGDKIAKYPWLCIPALILSFLSKPSAVVFPLIIVAIDFIFYKRSIKEVFKSVWWMALAIIPIMIRAKLAESNVPEDFGAPLWARPFVFFDSLSFYLVKIIAPLNLVADYGRRPQYVMTQPTFYFSWLLPVILLAVSIILKKHRQALLGALAIFTIGFLTVSGLVTFYFQDWSTVADRYIYVSMLGFAIFFVYVLSIIGNERLRVLFAAIVLIACSLLALNQVPVWRNEVTLWENVINKYPGRSSYAYTGRGYYYLEEGKHTQALADFDKALEINPKNSRALYNRGNIFFDTGDYEKAIRDYSNALDLKLINPNVYYNRGISYSELGMLDKAIRDYTMALKIEPGKSDVIANRGTAYAKKGDYENAIKDFTEAIKIDPNDEDSRANLQMAIDEKEKLKMKK